MNSINIIGRLTKDPELNATYNGKNVVNFSIAVNDGKDRDGNEIAYFFDCVAWEKTAELISQYFRKGQQISLTGKLVSEVYQDKAGQNRKNVKIRVSELTFLDGKRDEPRQSAPQASHEANQHEPTLDITDQDLPF